MKLPAVRSTPPPVDTSVGPDPLREIVQLHQRMNQLRSSMLGPAPFAAMAQGSTPLADVSETDDAYLVEIDVPGVDRKNLNVEVAASELRVSGEIIEKQKIGWLRHRTRRVGRFAYRADLPCDIDTDHVSADLADGVLTVRVPKSEAAKARRITVNAG
ncbi:Hsp20/alpha crystallin family protein [Micromonospora chalcea]|uniref:Hsp20/alpha crystallin family protein n=1 Tax=Micromonospora chalcea TaxID=1874 RepID=UPI0037F892EF